MHLLPGVRSAIGSPPDERRRQDSPCLARRATGARTAGATSSSEAHLRARLPHRARRAMVAIAYKVITGAHLAISKFGLGFLDDTRPGSRTSISSARCRFIYGTAVTSGVALLLALPIGVAIGLYLSLLAPQRLRGVIGPLVEMLAAIPSVILGLWGILVLAPFIRDRRAAGSTTRSASSRSSASPQTAGASVFTAGADPDDHGHPDHRLDQPRPLPDRPARDAGRRDRARRDALGGRPRRHPAVDRAAASCRRRSSGSAARSARRSRSRR